LLVNFPARLRCIQLDCSSTTTMAESSNQWQSVAESLSKFGFEKSRSLSAGASQSPKMTIAMPKLDDGEGLGPTQLGPSTSAPTTTARRQSGNGSHRRWSNLLEQSIVESPKDEQARIVLTVPAHERRQHAAVGAAAAVPIAPPAAPATPTTQATPAAPSSFWGSMTAKLTTTKQVEVVSTTVQETTTMTTSLHSRQGSSSTPEPTEGTTKDDPSSTLTKRRTLLGLVREQMRSGSLFGLSAGQDALSAIGSSEFGDIQDIIENETDLKRLKQTIEDLHKAYQGKSSALSRSLFRIETLRCEVKAEKMQQEDSKELLDSLRLEIRKLQEEAMKRNDEQSRTQLQEETARQTRFEQAERASREKERNLIKRVTELERALGIAHDEVARLSARSNGLSAEHGEEKERRLSSSRKHESCPQLSSPLTGAGGSPSLRSASRRQSIYELPAAVMGNAGSHAKDESGPLLGHRRAATTDLTSSISNRRHSLLGDSCRLPVHIAAQEPTSVPIQNRRGSMMDLRLSGQKRSSCIEAAVSSASSRRASIIEHAATSGGSPMIRMSSNLPCSAADLEESVLLENDGPPLPDLVRTSSDTDTTSSLPPTPTRPETAIPTSEPQVAVQLPMLAVIAPEEIKSLDLAEIAAQLRMGPVDDKSTSTSPNLSHYYQQNTMCNEMC